MIAFICEITAKKIFLFLVNTNTVLLRLCREREDIQTAKVLLKVTGRIRSFCTKGAHTSVHTSVFNYFLGCFNYPLRIKISEFLFVAINLDPDFSPKPDTL